MCYNDFWLNRKRRFDNSIFILSAEQTIYYSYVVVGYTLRTRFAMVMEGFVCQCGGDFTELVLFDGTQL